jgi:SP family arabinose:H+ symporter-like MFS transporter
VSGASPGGAAEAILADPAADRFGRKKLLIADAGIHATRAIIPAVTPDAAVRLFARTLIGLAIGADSAIATASVAEYAPKNRHGSLAMLRQSTITVGILVAYIVALIVFSAFPGGAASTGWRLVLGLGAIPALMGLGLHAPMPQSPGDCSGTAASRDAQGHGHPRHEGCQRRRHAASRHVGNGAGSP